MVLGYLGNIIGPRDPNSTVKKLCGWRRPKQTNKQTRNETSRGVSQQVRLGTILRVDKQENHGKPTVTVNGDLILNSKDQNL